MLGISHLLISGTSASLLLGTADPAVIAVGAIAGLLPDVDVSTSPAGRVLPWVSGYLEERMPHRSCTHSLASSAALACASYIVVFFFPQFVTFAHALNVGYFFGWFADCFTRGGVEMFWPSPIRCVCPGNRNLRLRTGSNAEYFVLVILVAIALSAFSVNSSGGIFTNFNRLIASPSGVTHIYNESGSAHKIVANITGVRVSDRAKIQGKYLLIQQQGTGFIVLEESTGKLYKAGNDPDSQIITEFITADVGAAAITNIEAITLNDEPVGATLAKFNRAGAMVFVSGQIFVDDFDTSAVQLDPYQFPYIKAAPSTITLEAAPLVIVQRLVGEEFASGNLQVRSITSSV
ncbi:putative membrane-bound metal-dependent hydrolase [Cylindrospermum stagnale PCC 7417]|uniref:Putative membrane-bound metal-dependent hydrolase n=1 Tax=Cylindrospermum stagnale PCC 7417 TaxID=56107 RepID=K9X3K1_9NOST|nr:metal-dependent hydrolase [Cylindrospermum stagnale]AFZ27225.1 putative membrane-bound metal-dependent hydrolase [Cylindrospermum stagnale PCC 7417]